MYKDHRAAESAGPASTPAVWAQTFAGSGRLSAYHRLTLRTDHRWRLIRRLIPPGARILDAGSGAGEWVAFLHEQGYRAEGLDYSAQLVERARRMYPDLSWRVGRVQALPYDAGSFDALISWGVIEHDEAGPAAALSEFGRVLKPGGIVVVTVPVDTERQRRASRSHHPVDHLPADRRAFFQYFMTSDELAGHLRSASFEVIDSGLQRSTALTLLFPEWSARLSLAWRNRLNKLVRLTCWWYPGAMNMTYAIGRKR
jgi:ubiquinone/menaquinone biosynthesis C-methylase UbiE